MEHIQSTHLFSGFHSSVSPDLKTIKMMVIYGHSFPHSSAGKESTCDAGDPGSILGLGRSAGVGIDLDNHNGVITPVFLDFPGGSDGKESSCNAGDLCSIPGFGGSPGGRQSNPLQYSCLENPMDKGAWQASVHAVAKSQTQPRD